jgi:branched-chain amino acid transport system permease protein
MSGYLESQLVILCLSIIYAYGIFLPAASGQLNLGAAGFITLGAYASGWFNTTEGMGLSMPVSMVLAVLFTGAISFAMAFPILRTRGVYMVLATFAFAEIVSGLTINMEFLGAAAGMPVEAHASLAVLVFAAIGVILFSFYFMSTRLGLALRSIHDDESVSVLFGVNVRMAKVAAFTVGGMLMGLAGAMYGHHYNYIEAQSFNVLLSIYILLYVLLGGTQTAWGPLVGAIFFTVVPELIRNLAIEIGSRWLADSRFIFFGAFIILMMVVRPEGVVTRTIQDRISSILFGRRRKNAAPAE